MAVIILLGHQPAGRWQRRPGAVETPSRCGRGPLALATGRAGDDLTRLPRRSRPPPCTIAVMNATTRRTALLVQLPIPPLGPAPVRGNVPSAAAYLKLWAGRKGLDQFYDIQVFPATLANSLGDQQLAEALAARDPWLVCFTCYLWNIERTLWIARELKKRRPGVRIVLGGPEITADNAWVLQTADYDFAVIGEGEQTFAD